MAERTTTVGRESGAADLRRREPECRIPEGEIRLLALRIADARDWAARGNTGLGYAVLLRGLIHAEQFVLEGKKWAKDLVGCWRGAIAQYCAEYDPQRDEE